MVVLHPPFFAYGDKMADIELMHITFRADTTFYFYEGELPVKDGVLTISDENQGLVRRAYALGYRLDPETGVELSPEAVQTRLETGDWPTAETYAAPTPDGTVDPEEDDDAEPEGEDETEGDEPEADDATEDDGDDE